MRTLLITSLFCAVTLTAADFGGTWLGQVPIVFNGQHLRMSEQFAIKFVQSGTKLEGKLYGDYKSAPIVEGSVSGDTIDFIVIAQEQQGNQINESRLHFTGTLQKDGEIELTRVREGATNAGNSGTYQYKADRAKSTFRLKRLP